MKIYLIRHGETTGDIEDRYGGSYDDHLTDLGKNQIKETAQKLLNKNIEIIFSSPLIRAKETSNIISFFVKSPVEIIKDLEERSYGVLSGLKKDESKLKFPKEVEMYKNPLNTITEGESFNNFKERVIRVFKSILLKQYNTIGIVSHGGTIRSILSFLNKNIPERIGDGEIIELDVFS